MNRPTFAMKDVLQVLAIKEMERGWYEAELAKAQATISLLEAQIADSSLKKVQ